MARFTSLVLSLALFKVRYFTNGYHAGSGLVVQSDMNQALYGYSFFNISGIKMQNCLERCMENCLCLSFQVYNAEPQSCQLCSSNKYLNEEAMHKCNGCTSFNFRNLLEVNDPRCDRSCTNVINCCKTSNPCLNGGTCSIPIPGSGRRFNCQCRSGYEGERCDHSISESSKSPKKSKQRRRKIFRKVLRHL